jgi:tetratricopeptide (TPR) repeat protein
MLRAVTVTGLLILAGCASAPTVRIAAVPAQILWRDQEFNYDATPVPVGTRELFALDAGFLATLEASGMKDASTQKRVDYLMSLLFGPGLNAFPYAGNESTIAAETWRARRGNCLSLSVLAYSIARALHLPAQLQEVRVPQYFDRHGIVDFVARHVNVLINNEARLHLKNGTMTSGNVVIDFEPQTGWLRAGTALSEASVLARYYNNVAAEYFARDNLAPAYAWFKAAILADEQYGASYSNLAQLYKRKGIADSAEQLLLHAIALDGADDTAVRSMHQLLVAQGRDVEALKYANLLQARQEKNPYFWLGRGIDYLQDAKYADAVRALERAEALTSGFDEVHRYLAIAYWRSGEQAKAQRQLTALASLIAPNSPDPGFAALSRKISKAPDN